MLHDHNLACQYADNLLIFAGGELKASGVPGDSVTRELLAQSYGVALEILYDSAGLPIVQPLSRHHPLMARG